MANAEEVEKFYKGIRFETMLKDAPESIQEFLRTEISFIKKNISPQKTILEVGCGYGRLLKILAKSAKKVVGIDFNQKMIKLSKENLKNKKNIKLYLMRAQDIKLNEKFDYVVCLDASFGNMPKMEKQVLKNMKNCCKKEGKIIISTYSENAKKAQEDNYNGLGFKIINDDGKAIHTKEGFYSRRFTKQELKELFSSIGLTAEITSPCPIEYITMATNHP